MPVTNLNLAMWSGPRNISTAMMRAWENRQDCEVWDEPLYGYYLKATGIDHPGAEEVMRERGTDWQSVVRQCLEPAPNGSAIFYQKHITLHMLEQVDRDWMASVTNCFLIREPERVIASYAAVREQPTLDDIGFTQQQSLFDHVADLSGEAPLVIDSREFLLQPESMLRALCQHVQVEFDPAMLQWPAGERDSDGSWGKYWYQSVWNSTGFAAPSDRPLQLNKDQQQLADRARPYYEALYRYRLRPGY